jgi:DNA-directed RNA polymerase specialized sigma24 family protein
MTGAGNGSFEAFVAERSAALLRTAYLLTGARGPALDLLQTALIAAYRRWDGIADGEEATAFVRRELVAAHTGWRRRLWMGDLLADSPLLAGTAGLPGFGRPTADVGPRDEMTAALVRLPPRMRAALVLRYGEGLSEAATADALGSPVERVRTQTRLGLTRLRGLLDEMGAASQEDGALVARLCHALAVRSADVSAAPDDTHERVLDGARAQRRHLAGLVALAAFVLIVLLLVVTIG